MADLVNDTHKQRLSQRNSEPSHLKGGSYETLGGPGIASQPGGDDYKIDAGKGISPDTTIPKSVGAEASHLKTEEEKDVDVSFDGDTDELSEVDDLDKELDQFESVEPVDVDVDVEDEDEVKKEDFNFEKGDDEDEKKVEEEDETEKEEEPIKEESEKKCDCKDGECTCEEDEKPEDEKLEEEDEEEQPEQLKQEAVRIRIKMPQAKLFESANLAPKTQKKVAVVFEQVVRDTTKQVASQLHAHYRKLHEQKIAQRDAVMAKQVDAYLNYVTEEWVKANKVAIRQSLRAQLAEEFMNGLQRLFKEHYIDVPESKVDVVKKLTEQNAKLKKSLNEQIADKMKLRKLAESTNKARIVAEFARNMSEASSAKLQKLAEDVQYTSAKDFRERLSMLKESYFPEQKGELKHLPEETVQVVSEETKKSTKTGDEVVDAVVGALSRQAKLAEW